MIGNNSSLVPPWSNSDMEGIVEDALRVLERIGVACSHAETVRRLREQGGVEHRNGRLYFAASCTREAVRSHRHTGPAEPDDRQLSMGGSWACLQYCDPHTGVVRPGTTDEAVAMARLWESRGYAGAPPLQPGDVPPRLVTLACERIGLLNSRGLGGSMTVTDPQEVRFLVDMNLAAGRRYTLAEQVSISPLRFNDMGLETALTFLDNPDVRVQIWGAIPMAGATCPLDPRSAVVQSVAEGIAHDRLCQALGLGPGGMWLRVEPFDFQYAFIVFGSPEWCLYRLLVLQVQEFLDGRPPRGGMFRSVSKQPDAQAACERTASVLWQAMLGIRRFGAVGQLSVDEVFSPQQAVIDREILGYVQRLVRGHDFRSPSPDALALIGQGVAEDSFIGVDDTVQRFREFYDFPALFRHWTLGRWTAEGQPSLLQEAWQQAQAEITGCSFSLPGDQEREVERLYAKAVAHIQGA